MLQQMLRVTGGMNDINKLNTLLAAVISRLAHLEDPSVTAERLRVMASILLEDHN